METVKQIKPFHLLLLILMTVGFGLVVLSVKPAQAIVVLSNLTADDGKSSTIRPTTKRAAGFTIPTDSDFRLNFVTLQLANIGSKDRSVVVEIWSDADKNPGELVQALQPILLAPEAAGNFTTEPLAALTLEAGKTYWLVVYATNNSQWIGSEPAQAPSGLFGFVAYQSSSDGGSTWSNSKSPLNKFYIDASAPGLPTSTITPTPTASNTPIPTNTFTITPSRTPRPTRTPRNTATRLPTRTPTDTATATETPTASDTPIPTNTFTITPSRTPRPTRTPRNTATRLPTRTPTDTATATETPTASNTPIPTNTFTITPSRTPTPTRTPRNTATRLPTRTPTKAATATLFLTNTLGFTSDATGTVEATAEATSTLDSQRSCEATTLVPSRLRQAPSTTSATVAGVPEQTTLSVLASQPEWYQVIYQGTRAWISASLVVTRGNCG